MAKQFKTVITNFYDNNKTTERIRDESFAEMATNGYTLFSTTSSNLRILDTFVKDHENFSD